jgi:hypothetical protein
MRATSRRALVGAGIAGLLLGQSAAGAHPGCHDCSTWEDWRQREVRLPELPPEPEEETLTGAAVIARAEAVAERQRLLARERRRWAQLDRAYDARQARLARAAERAAQRAAEAAAAQEQETPDVSAAAVPTAPAPAPSSSADWQAIAACESGGNWSIDSTYDGGLQFHPQTWLAYRLPGYPAYAYLASPAQQIAVAERVLAAQGPGAWPNCFASN